MVRHGVFPQETVNGCNAVRIDSLQPIRFLYVYHRHNKQRKLP